jgi:AraC-like DNA-binding protein
MLHEPTTLASVARVVGETLHADYGIDPEPLFEDVGIDTRKFFRPGARTTFAKMTRLWEAALEASGDPLFGFRVGGRAMPSDFFVLGHAWIASASLLGAMNRLSRYRHVVSTAYGSMQLSCSGDTCEMAETFPKDPLPAKAAMDGGYAAFMRLCDIVTETPVRPLRVELLASADGKEDAYTDLFRCPITFNAERELWIYAASDLEKPLAGSIPDVADATDRIADQYLASFDDGTVSIAVRELLVKLLPSGKADQERIAGKLYRSTSTLQRQLSSEGTTYRRLLDATRRELAERYLRDGRYSQAQIAFMVGFADQSNFARAFKRWTGMSPGEYQEAA